MRHQSARRENLRPHGPPGGPEYPASHTHCVGRALAVDTVCECAGQSVQPDSTVLETWYVLTGHAGNEKRNVFIYK